jgi:hypothetical protein
VSNHDMPFKWKKKNTKGTVSESQQKREKDKGVYPWKPICGILDGAAREFQRLDWPIGCTTSEQAEKAGLLVSKKWIDAGMPEPLTDLTGQH